MLTALGRDREEDIEALSSDGRDSAPVPIPSDDEAMPELQFLAGSLKFESDPSILDLLLKTETE